MREILHEAGWPAWPTLLLALSCLAVALRHALVPQRSLVPLAVGSGVAALLMGTLGTVLGVHVSIRHVVELPPEQRFIVLVGVQESLGNLGLALAATLPAALLAAVGSWRMARRVEAL